MKIKNIKKILISLLSVSFISFNTISSYSADSTLDYWQDNTTSLPVTVDYFSSAEYGDNIYYIGGYDRASETASNIVQIYNTKTNTWSNGANMPTARFLTDSIQYNGKIYCFGGADSGGTSSNGNTLDIIEVYDIKSNSWSSLGKMPEPKERLNAIVYNNKALLIGGYTNRKDYSLSNSICVLNLDTLTWESNIPMGFYRVAFTSQIYNDKLYIFSGNESHIDGTNIDYSDVNIYDFKTKTWSKGAESSIKRHGVTSVKVGPYIYVFGGRGNYQNRKEVEVYNFQTDSWDMASISPIEIHWGRATLKNNKVYCVSGEKTNGVFATYNPKETPKISSNIDIYIQPQSILSASINTNTVSFEDVDFINDIEITNAIELSISSSLPYQVNTSLETDITNNDNTNNLNPDVLSIKANNESDYKTFNSIGTSITLLDNQESTDSTIVGIDLRLNSKDVPKFDNYKTVLRIEVKQI